MLSSLVTQEAESCIYFISISNDAAMKIESFAVQPLHFQVM